MARAKLAATREGTRSETARAVLTEAVLRSAAILEISQGELGKILGDFGGERFADGGGEVSAGSGGEGVAVRRTVRPAVPEPRFDYRGQRGACPAVAAK
jgi:hypothetical protein